MAVEINSAIENLQIKHQPTQKWSNAITLLEIEGGYGIRLIDEQMEEIEAIAQNIRSLATLSSAQEIQRTLKLLDESLQKLIIQAVSQDTNVTAFYQAVSSAIGQLTQVATALGATNQGIVTQLTALSNAVNALTSSLQSSPGTTAPTDTGETDIDEAVITITTANEVQPYALPNTTRSLIFSGKKDSLDRSYDIYWSFKNGNIQQKKHKTLWAYCEFQKTGLSFNDKTLYLSCSVPIQIDLCAYFS
jgi:hypothetical protein